MHSFFTFQLLIILALMIDFAPLKRWRGERGSLSHQMGHRSVSLVVDVCVFRKVNLGLFQIFFLGLLFYQYREDSMNFTALNLKESHIIIQVLIPKNSQPSVVICQKNSSTPSPKTNLNFVFVLKRMWFFKYTAMLLQTAPTGTDGSKNTFYFLKQHFQNWKYIFPSLLLLQIIIFYHFFGLKQNSFGDSTFQNLNSFVVLFVFQKLIFYLVIGSNKSRIFVRGMSFCNVVFTL